MKGMTGYGSGSAYNEIMEVRAEARSLNGKSLRLKVHGSKVFAFLTVELNELAKKFFERGEIDLYLDYIIHKPEAFSVSVNTEVLGKLLRPLKEAKLVHQAEITLSFGTILGIPGLVEIGEPSKDLLKELTLKAVSKAFEGVLEDRINEGERIKQFILSRIKRIENWVEKLEGKVSNINQLVLENLKRKLKELVQDLQVDQQRLEAEAVFLAEKQDVSEEIERLKIHIQRLKEVLNWKESVGKSIDFLCQEMNREINTISSKIKDAYVSDEVVAIKLEISKIREQAQNVE